MLAERDSRAIQSSGARQLRLPFRRKASSKEDIPMRAATAAMPFEICKRPNLRTPKEICSLYPVKIRTLKYWVQHASNREVSCQGRRRTIPGNGLGPAIVRKGRLIFIDEDLFLMWLYEGSRNGKP
jgi:hypothetical protein